MPEYRSLEAVERVEKARHLAAISSPRSPNGSGSGVNAARELQLAQRERTLADYAAEVAERSAKADERNKLQREWMEAEIAAVNALKKDLDKREKSLAVRLRAAAEWEQKLREREKGLALSSPQRSPQMRIDAAVANDEPEEEAAEEEVEEPQVWDEYGVPVEDVAWAADYLATGGASAEYVEEAEAGEEAEEVDDENDEGGEQDQGYPGGGGDWVAGDAAGVAGGNYPDALEFFGEGGGEDDEADWMAVRDDETSNVYYWNRRTNEVSWEPRGLGEEEYEEEEDYEEEEQEPLAVIEHFVPTNTVMIGGEAGPSFERGSTPVPQVDPPAATLPKQQQQQPYRRKISADELRRGSSSDLAPSPSPAAELPQLQERPQFAPSFERRVRLVAPSEEKATKKKASPKRDISPPRVGRAEPKWARESAALRDALAAARKGGGGDLSQPDDSNDGRVECPHCKRRFKPEVAERHIPQCQQIKTKPRAVTGKR